MDERLFDPGPAIETPPPEKFQTEIEVEYTVTVEIDLLTLMKKYLDEYIMFKHDPVYGDSKPVSWLYKDCLDELVDSPSVPSFREGVSEGWIDVDWGYLRKKPTEEWVIEAHLWLGLNAEGTEKVVIDT